MIQLSLQITNLKFSILAEPYIERLRKGIWLFCLSLGPKVKVSSKIKATFVLSISVNAELKHTRFAHFLGGRNGKMRIKLLWKKWLALHFKTYELDFLKDFIFRLCIQVKMINSKYFQIWEKFTYKINLQVKNHQNLSDF